MLLDIFVMLALSVHESVEFVGLSLLLNLERQAALHLIEDTIDLHELLKEVGAGKGEAFAQVLPGAVVEPITHVALPKAEHLADQVMLEEFHARQNIEHG